MMFRHEITRTIANIWAICTVQYAIITAGGACVTVIRLKHHGNIAIYHRADRYQSGNSRTNFRTNAAYYGSIYVHHGAEHIYQRDGHTYYRTSRMYYGAKRDQHRNKCSYHENTGAYSRNGPVHFFNK
jgi:hypothetical protein